MAKHLFAVAAVAAALALPASASVITIGNSAARFCYEAADARVNPSKQAVTACDLALSEEGLAAGDVVATYVNRGIVRLRRGDTEAAISDFDRAIALDPDQAEAFLNKGVALVNLSDSAPAVQMFTMALRQNTQKPALAHYGRAIAHERLGNIRGAYMDYRRASELDPEWSDPKIELQRFQVVSG